MLIFKLLIFLSNTLLMHWMTVKDVGFESIIVLKPSKDLA